MYQILSEKQKRLNSTVLAPHIIIIEYVIGFHIIVSTECILKKYMVDFVISNKLLRLCFYL